MWIFRRRRADPVALSSEVEVHVLPRSDILNDPVSAGHLLMPSLSAGGIVSPWASGDPNTTDGMQNVNQANLLYQNQATITGQQLQYQSNVTTGTPSGVKATLLQERYDQAIAMLQGKILGSP